MCRYQYILIEELQVLQFQALKTSKCKVMVSKQNLNEIDIMTTGNFIWEKSKELRHKQYVHYNKPIKQLDWFTVSVSETGSSKSVVPTFHIAGISEYMVGHKSGYTPGQFWCCSSVTMAKQLCLMHIPNLEVSRSYKVFYNSSYWFQYIWLHKI